MPLTGTLDVGTLLSRAPAMPDFDTEPLELHNVELLQLSFEIDDTAMTALLPPALHPTVPPLALLSMMHAPESPYGAFTLAQVRAGARSAALPRGFLLGAWCDSEKAAQALAARWGYNARVADVRLRRYHDRITGTVSADGADALRMSLADPEPISGADVQYVVSVHLATGADGKPALVQVDPAYTFHRAERGRPSLEQFDAAAWHADGMRPAWPVAATFTTVDLTLPQIRFVLDPSQPAVTGTRRLR